MGSLQQSQCLSPPFPLALRKWSPCARHLLHLQQWEELVNFTLRGQASREGFAKGLGSSSQGQADPAPDPWESARPAASWICPGGRSGGPAAPPCPTAILPGPQTLPRAHSPAPGAPPALSAPLGSEQSSSCCLSPSRKKAPAGGGATSPRKPQGANHRRRTCGDGRALQPANKILRERTSARRDCQSPEHTASKARPLFSRAPNPQGRCAVAPPRGGDKGEGPRGRTGERYPLLCSSGSCLSRLHPHPQDWTAAMGGCWGCSPL